MSVKHVSELGWDDQRVLSEDVELVWFWCSCGHVFEDRPTAELDRETHDYSLSEVLCPECFSVCHEVYGMAERMAIVDNLRADWHLRMESRLEGAVRRQSQYPEYQDEKGYVSELSVLEKLCWRRPARKMLGRRGFSAGVGQGGFKYTCLAYSGTGIGLDLISEHPDKMFYTRTACDAARGAVQDGSDWLGWRVVTAIRENTISGVEMWRRQWIEVLVSPRVLDPVDQRWLRQHIQTQLGLKELLMAAGLMSLKSLRLVLELMGVPESVSGVLSRDTMIAWCPVNHPALVAFDAGHIGIRMRLYPEGDLFTSSELVEIERQVGVTPGARKFVNQA